MKTRTWIIPVAGALAMSCMPVSTQAAPIGGVTSARLDVGASTGLEQAHYYRRHYRYYRYYRRPDFYFYRHHRRHHRYYRHW
jgi:hypothetical protein